MISDDGDSTKHAAKLAADDVPKLPRGRGIRLSRVQLVRIVGTAAMLAVLLLMQRPCSRAVSNFVTSFDARGSGAHVPAIPARGSGSARSQAPESGVRAGPGSDASNAKSLDGRAKGVNDYEHLQPGMTDDELKAAIERARIKASQRSSP